MKWWEGIVLFETRESIGEELGDVRWCKHCQAFGSM